MKLLVTGGAGFIGSNFIRHILEEHPNYKIFNLDKLTYAGNLNNLKGITSPNYTFFQGDICNYDLVRYLFEENEFDAVVHFAAETHVDRSNEDPGIFLKTNIGGSFSLLSAAETYGLERFIHISTDEVYGSLSSDSESSKETDPLSPTSPYAISKAAGDKLAQYFFKERNVPTLITRASNNYGPFQFPEKFLPFSVTELQSGKKIKLMWSDENPGLNVRDWLHVKDNCRAIDLILHKGEIGEIYNIAGKNEHKNIDVANLILDYFGYGMEKLEKIPHRQSHDFRYSIDSTKLKELGFKHKYKDFKKGLYETIKWYVDNRFWWEPLK
ncbi:dTDP-glucose 4,6-dehydratase [Candidatus Woesearchaeota archaeon]|nr:dTDP-glucose 4,6-dehydratase [Candidatus Woesearchaeota archaeon]